MCSQKPIRIDIGEVLASRSGGRGSLVPRFVVKAIENLICADTLNSLLENNFPRTGADFCHGVLADLGVTVNLSGKERLPDSPRALFVCNHPLGGLDGIGIIDCLASHYGTNVHVVVNDLLMAVDPLRKCFVPVNKHGAQNRNSVQSLDAALAGDNPVVIFPAGLCSRRQPDGSVADLKWNKMFVNKAIEYRRNVVTMFFDGLNSPAFYRTARLRQMLGIKFNIEMLLLPRELVKARGKVYSLIIGPTVDYTSLAGGKFAAQTAASIKQSVYEITTTSCL